MPIRRELRWLYPIDWSQLSRAIRFGRARGRCEHCRRPHGTQIACLPDGRWLDPAGTGWRDKAGRPVRTPRPVELGRLRHTRVVLATAHLDHDPCNNTPRNLRSLCQRCHMLHDRPHHLAQRRLTYRRRWALGDLFTGPYRF
ncbi:hypothetical protein ACFOD4_21780 [Pseudoroseomonas globiformis]|uniref:HNH endonuclease n=1 Tax=Teichococcus globiformis TaxID=2307229 RepID=A0ABV7G832_9PROT